MKRIEKATAVGINHVSIQVGNIEKAIAFYSQIFSATYLQSSEEEGVIDLGDQFIAFTKGDSPAIAKPGHFGFVVDDKEKVRSALSLIGIEALPGRFLGFLDPWGNHIEVITYENIKFTKNENVLKGMQLYNLKKNARARKELADSGMA